MREFTEEEKETMRKLGKARLAAVRGTEGADVWYARWAAEKTYRRLIGAPDRCWREENEGFK